MPRAAIVLGLLFSAQQNSCATTARKEAGELATKLSQATSVTWQELQLADVVDLLNRFYGVPVWLDRRIDPNCIVEAAIRKKPLLEIINAVAGKCGARAVAFRSLVYIGPEQSAGELATLAELAERSLSRLPLPARRRWERKTSLAWSQVAEPGDLLRQIAGREPLKLANLQLLPHDLWGAKSLPPLSAIDQATLLLIGFDLTCRISTDGNSLQIARIKRPVQATRTYQLPASSTQRMTELLNSLEGARWTRAGRRWQVAARVEQHAALQASLSGKPSASAAMPPRHAPRGERVFTLAIENQPLGPVVEQIAKQIGVAVKWGPGLESQKQRLVSCKVSEASAAELWEALFAPTGLTAKQTGDGLLIMQRQSDDGD